MTCDLEYEMCISEPSMQPLDSPFSPRNEENGAMQDRVLGHLLFLSSFFFLEILSLE